MSISVFGSINIDLTAYGEHLPRPGETLHGDRYAIGLGGKGCNQAAAASRLGSPTNLVGRIGQDEFGARAQAELAALGIATDAVFEDPGSDTGLAVIGVDSTAQNCITVIGGANMAIDGSDVHRAAESFRSCDILLLQMEIPLEPALMAADLVRQNGGRVILDPAPAPKDGYTSATLSRIDLITPNETETELLTGLKPANAAEAARAAGLLRGKGVAAAVIKLGASGVYYQDPTAEGFVEPFKVDSIDSVAAGDCFNGGLAVALSEGAGLGEAVRFAAACGALSTTKRGAASSAPSRPEVEALLGND